MPVIFPGYSILLITDSRALQKLPMVETRLPLPDFYPLVSTLRCFDLEDLGNSLTRNDFIPYLLVINLSDLKEIEECLQLSKAKCPAMQFLICCRSEEQKSLAGPDIFLMDGIYDNLEKKIIALHYLKMASPTQAIIDLFYAVTLLTPCPENPTVVDDKGKYAPLQMLCEMMRGTEDGQRFIRHEEGDFSDVEKHFVAEI